MPEVPWAGRLSTDSLGGTCYGRSRKRCFDRSHNFSNYEGPRSQKFSAKCFQTFQRFQAESFFFSNIGSRLNPKSPERRPQLEKIELQMLPATARQNDLKADAAKLCPEADLTQRAQRAGRAPADSPDATLAYVLASQARHRLGDGGPGFSGRGEVALAPK